MSQLMDNLSKGIVEVDGVTISPETTLQDLENIGLDKGVQRFHHGEDLEFIFNQPVEYDGVSFIAAIFIRHKDNSKVVRLDPKLNMHANTVMDESRMKQEVCEEWLKRNMESAPTRDTPDGIIYEFDWGCIYSAAAEHINFGHLNGCIHIVYGDLML